MSRQNINIGATANDGTGDTLRAAGLKINQNFAELYEKFGGDSGYTTALVAINGESVVFEGSTANGTTTSLKAENPTANRIATIPNATGAVVLDTHTQTLTNKTLTAPVISNMDYKDQSGSYVYNVVPGTLSASTNLRIPALTDSDTFTVLDASQTLNNKTLNSPVLVTPNVITSINDVNGAEMFKFTAVPSAVNEITVTNNASGGHPGFAATGTNTNINLEFEAKGTGSINLKTKVTVGNQTMTVDGAVSLLKPLTMFSASAPLAATMANGTITGELKYFLNTGSGTVTITPTSMGGSTSTIVLAQHEAATATWTGSVWYLLSKQTN
jgi:hypothetical protein